MAGTPNKDGTLSICITPQNADMTVTQFEALTYIPLECVITMPTLGSTTNMISQDCINTSYSKRSKGVTVGTDTEIVVPVLDATANPGIAALRTASLTNLNYAFKWELADSPNPTVTTNTVFYFRGLVGEAAIGGGGVEDFINCTYPFAQNQREILVPQEPV